MPASSPTTDPVEPDVADLGPVPSTAPIPGGFLDPALTHPVAEVVYRRRAQVQGRARSIRVRPWGDVPTLELVLADETAAITVAFLGRRRLAGADPGAVLAVEGMVGQRNGKLIILNPAYRLGG